MQFGNNDILLQQIAALSSMDIFKCSTTLHWKNEKQGEKGREEILWIEKGEMKNTIIVSSASM